MSVGYFLDVLIEMDMENSIFMEKGIWLTGYLRIYSKILT